MHPPPGRGHHHSRRTGSSGASGTTRARSRAAAGGCCWGLGLGCCAARPWAFLRAALSLAAWAEAAAVRALCWSTRAAFLLSFLGRYSCVFAMVPLHFSPLRRVDGHANPACVRSFVSSFVRARVRERGAPRQAARAHAMTDSRGAPACCRSCCADAGRRIRRGTGWERCGRARVRTGECVVRERARRDETGRDVGTAKVGALTMSGRRSRTA